MPVAHKQANSNQLLRPLSPNRLIVDKNIHGCSKEQRLSISLFICCHLYFWSYHWILAIFYKLNLEGVICSKGTACRIDKQCQIWGRVKCSTIHLVVFTKFHPSVFLREIHKCLWQETVKKCAALSPFVWLSKPHTSIRRFCPASKCLHSGQVWTISPSDTFEQHFVATSSFEAYWRLWASSRIRCVSAWKRAICLF